MISIDDAWQLARGLGAFALQLPYTAVEFVGLVFQDADENDIEAPSVLQLV